MADPETGYRIVQCLGNTNMQNIWSISRLMAGTYYWSVQSIDQAYSGSEFAEEGSFAVVATGVNDLEQDNITTVFPNPATNKIYVHSENPSAIEFKIHNVNGQHLLEGTATSGQAIDISTLKEGIYFIHMYEDDEVAIQRFIKQ
jgi:hypothetical protein